MNIYIMSRGRAGKVTTLKSIPESWRKRTVLVVNEEDAAAYRDAYEEKTDFVILRAPPSVTNYSQKFQWIMDGLPRDWDDGSKSIMDSDAKALIMDDDLVFSRASATGSLITERDPEKLTPMFEQIEESLDVYPLVGVHPRAMGQNAPYPIAENCRIICIQGINRNKIGTVKVDQFPILADVILNLTLLGRGDKTALITTFFQDHGPCQAPGGCSIYRTPAMQEEAIDYLVARWPGFVKKVRRYPKVAKWMGEGDGSRVEYTAQWKKLQRAAPDMKREV